MKPTLLLPLLVLLAACVEKPEPYSQGDGPELDVTSSTYSIFQTLKASGYQVEVAETIDDSPFGVPGVLFSVNGRSIQVFEFDSKEQTQEAVASVSIDGTTIDGAAMNWSAPVRFYRFERVITVLIGADEQMVASLDHRWDTPFAGTGFGDGGQ